MTHRFLHEITDDLAICPAHVTAVKRGIKKNTATVYVAGQGEQEGFTIKLSFEETVDGINQALSERPPSDKDSDDEED